MRTLSHVSGVLFFLALSVFAVCLGGCGKEITDEDRVWAAIEDMADAAEAKDIGRLKKHISKDYQDPAGNGYDQLKGLIAYQFLRSDDISIFLRRHEITVSGDNATANVRAVISRGRKLSDVSEAEPGSTGGFVFDFTFARDGSDWLLVSAIWRQVGIAEAL